MVFNTDPNRPIKEILDEIGTQAPAVFDKGAGALGLVLAPFAALIAKLSMDAEVSTRKVIRLTWWLIALTIALSLLTIPLFVEATIHLWRLLHSGAQ